MIAITEDGRSIEYQDEAGEGTDKRVFFSKDRTEVICLYKDPGRLEDSDLKRLKQILGPYRTQLLSGTDQANKHILSLFCWPTSIVKTPSVGIVTPTYQSNFFFDEGTYKGKEKNARWFISSKLRKRVPLKSLGNLFTRLRTCVRLARAIRKMHLIGVAHSDLSNNNVLIDLERGEAVVIDIDTLVVPNYYAPKVLGTKGYIAPEVVATMHLDEKDPQRKFPNIQTDLHALAVLIYEILLIRHPIGGGKLIHDAKDPMKDDALAFGEKALFIENEQDRRNRPATLDGMPITYDRLGLHLKKVFDTTFVLGLHTPLRRSSAASIESALNKTIDLLVPCENPNCVEKFFVYTGDLKRPVCPFCSTKTSQPLPILELMQEYGSGTHMKVADVVVYDKRILYEWHIYVGKSADENADLAPRASLRKNNNSWFIVNESVTEGMRSPNQNIVSTRQGIELKKGVVFNLSTHSKSYIAKVNYTA